MFKNVASQKLTVFAYDATTNLPKTGDAANLTAYVDKDDGGVTVLTDTSATEKDATNAKGYYIFDLTQGETNADKLLFTGKSSTANIVVIAVPAVVYTLPATGILAPTTAGRTLDVSATGEAGIDWANVGSPTTTLNLSGTTVGTLTTYTGNTPQTGDAYAIVNNGTYGNSALKSLIDAVDNFVDTEIADIQSRLPAALTGAGNMKCDALAISGDTVAADNAESFFDGTGYAGTNNVIPTVTTLTGHTPQTGDNYARLGAPAGASVSADIAAVKTDTGTLVTRITSSLFSGITSLAQWLGAMAGKQTANSTARTEIRATGAGSGTYDETTDSLEAVRDYTAPASSALSTSNLPSNFASLGINASGHISRVVLVDTTTTNTDMITAAGIRTAVGLASANLDTQLDALPTAAENFTAVLTTQMTEAYAADGTAPTLAQAVFLVMQSLHEFAISGTTRTVKKLDGSTTAATFTLDSSTAPTSTTRAS